MSKTEKIVIKQVSEILKSDQFKSWLNNAKLKKDGYIVFNNSYLFREREKFRTNKSDSYLTILFDSKKKSLSLKDLIVVTGMSINTDFQFFPKGSPHIAKEFPLKNALSDLVLRFGKMGFVLIGSIIDDVVLTEPINESGITEIVLDPKYKIDVKVDDSKIIIKRLFDDETLWSKLEKIINPLSEDLAVPIAKALNNLRERAYVRLKIPADVSEIEQTMLDEIINAFGIAITEYKSSLSKCKGDPTIDSEEYNNVLRIAYNFASDAMDLLRLIIQISDLKPIVLFTTIHNQILLSNSFKDLPWPRSEKKGSLILYEKTIKGARNRAFHRLFPFSKAINVDVEGLTFKARKLILFPEYGSQKRNTLDYEDRELVEIMTQFTRTTEHTVTPIFWQKNLVVMENTIALLKQLKNALVAILSDQRAMS